MRSGRHMKILFTVKGWIHDVLKGALYTISYPPLALLKEKLQWQGGNDTVPRQRTQRPKF